LEHSTTGEELDRLSCVVVVRFRTEKGDNVQRNQIPSSWVLSYSIQRTSTRRTRDAACDAFVKNFLTIKHDFYTSGTCTCWFRQNFEFLKNLSWVFRFKWVMWWYIQFQMLTNYIITFSVSFPHIL
jgi:hypothetical protein